MLGVCHSTWCNTVEDNHFHTCRHENLRSEQVKEYIKEEIKRELNCGMLATVQFII
jgi:hypothetical protein